MERSLPATEWTTALPPFEHAERFRWLEHETVWFPCYPHEMTAMQLSASAALTLKLARRALEHGWLLKDASAWNVPHTLGRPIFWDILSFEPWDGQRLWPAYAQFQRHFMIPLLAHRYGGIAPSQIFLSSREGLSPEGARPLVRGLGTLRPSTLEAIVLPKWLSRVQRPQNITGQGQRRRPANELSKALLSRTFSRLARQIESLGRSPGRTSVWTDYESRRNHYTPADVELKRQFVAEALAPTTLRTVLDVGCNAGEYALATARQGKCVVGIDTDEGALVSLQKRAAIDRLEVQPLFVDIARPTPAVGWRNAETASFLCRAAGQFDAVLLLGLLHHLLVIERVTLPQVAELLASLAGHTAIVEWVAPHDRRFEELAATNQRLYEHLTERDLYEAMSVYFCHVKTAPLAVGTRSLSTWRKL